MNYRKYKNQRKTGQIATVKIVKSKKRATVNTRKGLGNQAVWMARPSASDDFIISDNTGIQYNAFQFQLNQCLNYLKYVAIYDQYRILKVEVKFIPVMTTQIIKPVVNGNTAGINPESIVPMFYVVRDNDDAQLPVSINELRGRPDCKTVKATQSVRMIFKPKTTTPVYQDGVTNGYKINQKDDWLDVANSQIAYYGLKTVLETNNDDNAYIYRVMIRYLVEFKGTRA